MKVLWIFLAGWLVISPVHAEDNPEPKLDSRTLREKLAYGDPQTLSWAAKHVIPTEEFRKDWNSIFLILFRAGDGSKALSRLVRYRLAQPGPGEQMDARFQIALAAAQISDQDKRQEFLFEKIKMLKSASDSAIAEFVSKNKEISVPAGYRMTKPFLGTGKTSIVHLVERVSDGALFAWKLPTNDRVARSYEFRDEISFAQRWKDLGLTSMEIFTAPDGKSYFKTYIRGKMLRDLILDGSVFKEGDPCRAALKRFIEKLVRKKIAVRGLNAENLILNERTGEFEIIDGGNTIPFGSEDATFEHLRRALTDKWTRLSMGLADKREEISGLFKALKLEINPSMEGAFGLRLRKKKSLCEFILGDWNDWY